MSRCPLGMGIHETIAGNKTFLIHALLFGVSYNIFNIEFQVFTQHPTDQCRGELVPFLSFFLCRCSGFLLRWMAHSGHQLGNPRPYIPGLPHKGIVCTGQASVWPVWYQTVLRKAFPFSTHLSSSTDVLSQFPASFLLF